MHPALILARINIIFPVFADYVDSQLQKSTIATGLSCVDYFNVNLTSYKKKYQRNYGVSRTC